MSATPFGSMTPEEREEFLSQPALAAPDGFTSHLTNPESRNDLGLSVTIACTVIAWILFFLRLYAFFVYRKETRIQEGLALVAAATFTALLYPGYHLAKIGAFYVHQWDMDRHKFSEVLLMSYILTTMWYLTMLFAKSAIMLEWLRVFWPGHSRNSIYWICNITLGALVAFFSAGFIYFQARCQPFHKAWNPWLEGTCSNRSYIDKASVFFNITLDLVIFILPQTMVWRLHAPLKRRIGKSIIFSFALLGIGCGSGRAQNVHTFKYSQDVAYSLSSGYLWALGECTIVVLVYCALPISRIYTEPKVPPLLMPLNRWYKGKFGGSQVPANEAVSKTTKGKYWVPSKPSSLSPAPSNNVYERMDDSTQSEVHLTDLPPLR
ncbi:unnamed protein product [Clonostachys chloroleuca]|uniref:Rhodopsin domain-containing protein n=1 Tax=Clonostachys chloroleuca TaxID=1926264 RepID=A0AA35Q1G4_9HYPO|nr:unnamed protein product [Clonostachys chloroleuca]